MQTTLFIVCCIQNKVHVNPAFNSERKVVWSKPDQPELFLRTSIYYCVDMASQIHS